MHSRTDWRIKVNKYVLFKFLSTLSFVVAVFQLLNQEIIIGYSLLALGYCLLRKSDNEK